MRSIKAQILSHRALVLGILFFGFAIALYFWAFGHLKFWNYLSDKHEHWGQFGDFIGGLVNPLIGLVTIWLFSRSLVQNSEMISAAKKELKLARREIKRGVAAQKATEKALQSQINLASDEKDFNSAMSMLGFLESRKIELERRMVTPYNEADKDVWLKELKVVIDKWSLLTTLIESEFDDLALRLSKLSEDANLAVKEFEGYRIYTRFDYYNHNLRLEIKEIDGTESHVYWVPDIWRAKDLLIKRYEAAFASKRILLYVVEVKRNSGAWPSQDDVALFAQKGSIP